MTAKTRTLLLEHYKKYPMLRVEDIFKYLFQSGFSSWFLFTVPGAARYKLSSILYHGFFRKYIINCEQVHF
jgi:hypothetical protein